MATLLQDNFDRADSTSVLGSPQIGPAPTVVAGTVGIITNKAYASAVPGMFTYALGTTDVELSVLCSTISTVNSVSIILGYASLTDYYQVQAVTTGVTLYKYNSGGVATLMTSVVKVPVSGTSVLRAHYKSGIIRVYVDDVLVIRHVTDLPITATAHGLRFSNSGSVRADNLLGTDAPTIDESPLTGTRLEQSKTVLPAAPVAPSSFAYLGRDTKVLDIAEGA